MNKFSVLKTSFCHSEKHTFYNIAVKIFIAIFSITLLYIILPGCGDAITEPESGRRDYTWKVDTLFAPYQNSSYDAVIWGSSASDIWLIYGGFIYSEGTGYYKNSIWHYDGASWKTSSIGFAKYPSSMWGTASNNIWLTGSSNEIWHYDGNNWARSFIVDIPDGYDRIELTNVWGRSENDVWVAGYVYGNNTDFKSIILHYSKGKWQMMNIPELKTICYSIYCQESTGTYYIAGYNAENGDIINRIFTYDGKNTIKELFHTGYRLIYMNGEVYFEKDKKFYKYKHNRLELFRNLSGTEYTSGIIGRNENDFFCTGTSMGSLLHYDGNDIETVYQDAFFPMHGIVFEKDVFFTMFNYKDMRILHGELK